MVLSFWNKDLLQSSGLDWEQDCLPRKVGIIGDYQKIVLGFTELFKDSWISMFNIEDYFYLK